MRRYWPFALSLLVAAVAAGDAQAQFPLDPRALLGRLTAPFRHMLPRPPVRHRDERGAARSPQAPDADADRSKDFAKLGIVGPLSWPTAYEDVIGYTFWPQDYTATLRQHGFADISSAILTGDEPRLARAGQRPPRRNDRQRPCCDQRLRSACRRFVRLA